MPRLELTLLGGFQARLPARRALAMPRKAQALLAYLALTRPRAHARGELAALLWGDVGEAHARQSLRQCLRDLRRVVDAPGALHIDEQTVALDGTAVAVDVARFQELVTAGTAARLAEAAALYRGPLLAGLEVGEAAFEEWLARERERLRELALAGLGRLLEQQRKARSVEGAIQTAGRLLAVDPLHEPAHRALMRLYARDGRRAAALRQYQSCVELLHRELNVEPETKTKQRRHRSSRRNSVCGHWRGCAGWASVASTGASASPSRLASSSG